jgi:hypothetical protein
MTNKIRSFDVIVNLDPIASKQVKMRNKWPVMAANETLYQLSCDPIQVL